MGDFHKRLKRFREDRGLSMRQAAKRIGVAETTYREWEYGRQIRGEPYTKIAEAFGVSLEELFGAEKKATSLDQDLESLESLVRSIKSKTPK